MKKYIQTAFLIALYSVVNISVSVTECAGHEIPFSASVPVYNIIDTHEHISDKHQAYKFGLAIERHNIKTIILVGSPKEVLASMGKNKMRFTNSEWNNNELLSISRKSPEVFYPFATYSPDDTKIIKKLKKFIKNGGKGLKLYNGHYFYYDIFKIKLDAPHMMKVYDYCEKNRIPVVFHANARYYWGELKHVLDTYPELTVNLAHFCMSMANLDRISEIFNNYKNVYSDISCGEDEFAYTNLEYISRHHELYAELIQTYKPRFLFGTDLVLTDDHAKDKNYVEGAIACHRKMLEEDKYTGILISQYLNARNITITKKNSVFNGLHLDHDTLRHIYEINPRRFLGILEKE